jgi:hypothetical protein
VRRQRATVDASLLALIRCLVRCAVLLLLFLFRVSVGERSHDVFQRQLHLVAVKSFGSAALCRWDFALARQPRPLSKGQSHPHREILEFFRGGCVRDVTSMVAMGDAAMPVGERDADVLHHALVLVIEDVAMQHEIADVALVRVRTTIVYSPTGTLGPATFLTKRVSFQTPLRPGY